MLSDSAEVTITTIFFWVWHRFNEWAKTKAPSEYSSFVASVTQASPSMMSCCGLIWDQTSNLLTQYWAFRYMILYLVTFVLICVKIFWILFRKNMLRKLKILYFINIWHFHWCAKLQCWANKFANLVCSTL